jgi:hypothetical protein
MTRKTGVVVGCILIFAAATITGAQSQDPTVDVTSATYGSNCPGQVPGNATDIAHNACKDKVTCSFQVQDAAGVIGDHCVGTPKTFDATYLCGDEEKKVHVTGPSEEKTALMSCSSKKK